MPLYAAYNTDTGKIDRVTTSQHAVRDGEAFIAVDGVDYAMKYVKNGILVEYPLKPGEWAIFDYVANEWIDPRTIEDIYDEAVAVVREFRDAVNAKRSLIIASGTDVLITGHGVVALQGRPEDQTSLLGLAMGAQLRLGAGDSSTPMIFLDRNNVTHNLVPMQMLELWQKGAGFISAIYARSWVIKDMDPTTTDIDDPALWVIS